jgi:type II secretory pathway pseudopilin PulG
MTSGGQRRASLPEIVGAWLRVWTPPRDVDVPDVPVRKLLIGTAVALVVLGAAGAVIVPRIEGRKDRQAAEAAREHAQLLQARRLQAIREQRPQQLRVPNLRPAAGAPAATRVAARVSLLSAAQTAILADARHRVATGEMRGHPQDTSCEPYPPRDLRPERDLSQTRGVYDCLVGIRAIAATTNDTNGELGYPFRAVLDFKAFSVAWCRMNLVPGEKVIPDPAFVTALPRACRVPQR